MNHTRRIAPLLALVLLTPLLLMAFRPALPKLLPQQDGPQGIPERDYWPTDGWRSADPADQGMDGAQLDALMAEVEAHYPTIDSLLVVRGGYLVAERYFGGYDGQQPHDLRSATKSVVSALVGIALDRGLLPGLDARLSAYFPQYMDDLLDDRTVQITAADLITMRSGLLWTEGGRTTEYIMRSENYVAAALHLPQILDPGQGWNYSSADANLLLAMVQEAVGMSIANFAEEFLFGPLGIDVYIWAEDPQGYAIGGTGLYLTPRDMARFGFLYLNRGYWDGEQIVSEDWIEASWTAAVELDDSDYGYLWWLTDVDGYALYMALGYGGQRIYMLPDLDLVVVITADFSDPEAINRLPVLQGYVIPAILDGPEEE